MKHEACFKFEREANTQYEAKRASFQTEATQALQNQYEALEGCDALLIATEWSEFRNPDFDKMMKLLKEPVIFDGRNIYDLEAMQGKGFYYNSIGRETILSNSHKPV